MKKILYICLVLMMAVACSKSDEGAIIGTAGTDDGSVVAGITVKLYNDNTDFVRETTTDNAGNFAFYDVEEGNYYIGATVEVGGETYDTGNMPQIIYVSGEIEKTVSLTLKKK
ncbi:carboxypeptidase-like regulatory domain-containing protein [Sunxiuqinia elliptica]